MSRVVRVWRLYLRAIALYIRLRKPARILEESMKKAEKEDHKKICRWLAEWDARNMVMKKLGEIEKKVDGIEAKLGAIEKEKLRKEYTPEYIGKAVDRIEERIGGIERRVGAGEHFTLYAFLYGTGLALVAMGFMLLLAASNKSYPHEGVLLVIVGGME